jgi:hypothetical protein
MLVWTALGTLWPEPANAVARRGAAARSKEPARRPLALALAIVLLLFALRSATQATAMALSDEGATRAAIARAAMADPGSYRLRLWLARGDANRNRCKGVREHGGAANALFPSAPEPRRLLARCGVTVRRLKKVSSAN